MKEYKKAILVAGSGTTSEKARKENIEALEKKIGSEFEGFEVRRAFTSNKIISRLKDAGVYINTPKEALQKLLEEGFQEVVVQPLHIIPGSEYKRIIEIVREYEDKFEKITVGRPLLYDREDYAAAAEILRQEYINIYLNQAVVLMGHGGRGEGNESYSVLQQYIDELKLNIFVGTIKGDPGLDSIIDKLKLKSIEEVYLAPFMVAAGNHALADMASEEENSWRSRLLKAGFKVNVLLQGIGEKENFQKRYIQKIKELL